MFEWLEHEISTIRTPRFHLIDGPADMGLREAVIQSKLPVPAAYKDFILKFGNAKLYRNARNDSYRIGVFAAPREAMVDSSVPIYHIGFNDGATVYVKATSTIFEFETSERQVADTFEEWLEESCAAARNEYSDEKWNEILRGPSPFTPEEEAIIETRRRIRWRVLGIDSNGNHRFEVTNTSQGTLPVLTVGLRSKDGTLNGATRLDIAHVAPGQTAVLHVGCHKGLVAPTDIEAFSLPDPRPEDRERYNEFETM